MAVLPSTFDNAAKIEFGKLSQRPAQVKNLLSGIFTKKKEVYELETRDYISQVTAAKLSEAQLMSIDRATIKATHPDLSRRMTRTVGRNIHLYATGQTARRIGDKQYASKLRELIQNSINRSNQDMIVELLLDAYLDNPDIAGAARGEQVAEKAKTYFPLTQEFLCLPDPDIAGRISYGTAGAAAENYKSNARMPLSFDAFFGMCATIDNFLGRSATSKAGGNESMSIEDVAGVVIMSNSAWANFIAAQSAILGNKFTFGRPIYISGYGEFMMIQKYAVVTVPDEGEQGSSFQKIGGADHAVYGQTEGGLAKGTNDQGNRGDAFADVALPTSADYAKDGVVAFKSFGLGTDTFLGGASGVLGGTDIASGLVARGGSKTGIVGGGLGTARVVPVGGLNQALFVHKGAFALRETEDIDIAVKLYEDKDKSFEKKIYAEWSLKGIRKFDKGVNRLWFGDKYQRHRFNNLV